MGANKEVQMRGFVVGLSISVAFILGCVAAPLVVPPLSAQQTEQGVQRWEYVCMDLLAGGGGTGAKARQATEGFNRLGAEGWEFVGPPAGGSGWHSSVSCFKRPL
jgi:hypothetical protein